MPNTRTSTTTELLVVLDREGGGSLHHQLERQLRDSIRAGRLVGDSTMPSTRALARQLGVARGVVVEAYEQLVAEGYLLSRPGGGTRVAGSVSATTTSCRASTEPRWAPISG